MALNDKKSESENLFWTKISLKKIGIKNLPNYSKLNHKHDHGEKNRSLISYFEVFFYKNDPFYLWPKIYQA